jgi:REP element-mobilizing transposase RayT
MQLFDPGEEYSVVERRLPHWSQAGTITFITWRTWDSIPETILRNWQRERDAWLRRHHIDAAAKNWQAQLSQRDASLVREFQLVLSDRWNGHLDDCHGACVLRRPELADVVTDSLRHFDGKRYELTDLVVMPNHVHLLVVFPKAEAMLQQCESWKHFTATKINRLLDRKGRFWQQDGFDHLVRSLVQFEYLRKYIAGNPEGARLQRGEFVHYSKVLV